MKPCKLERQEPKAEPEIIRLLNSDIIVKIKFYTLFFGSIILFLLICFMLQPQTYGFFNW